MQQVKYVNIKNSEDLISFKNEYDKYNEKEIAYEDLISIIFSENIYVYLIQENFKNTEITFVINTFGDTIYVFYYSTYSIENRHLEMLKKKLESHNYNPNNFPIYTTFELLEKIKSGTYDAILS